MCVVYDTLLVDPTQKDNTNRILDRLLLGYDLILEMPSK